ncbi:type II toxin-antitoxin system HicA family toxin [Methylobacter sp.]|nr:type II toxin-antitoxin system HicA family toxin [Methylobacter sp.]MDI1358107.1 type II toxin-antitoxin system HicA family toxin [Methylobacter sp.]
MKVKDLIALIESDGWQLVRQRGSHRQFHQIRYVRSQLLANPT